MKPKRQPRTFSLLSTETVMRQPQPFPLLPSETVMPDDAMVYGMYVYIIDGVFRRSMLHEVTVAEFKRRENVKEVRRCDLFGHEGARLGDCVSIPEGAS